MYQLPKRNRVFLLATFATHAIVASMFWSAELSAQSPAEAANNWHQWRGPTATGVSLTAKPPIEWSETKNVQWKVPIDGSGLASPIIWNDKVFLLTAIKTNRVDESLTKPEDQPKQNFFDIKKPNAFYQFVVLCLDRKTGNELWRQVANEKIPHEGAHQDNDFAPASPMTDGKRLYCWFGSAGLFCYDLDGKELWKRDLGEAKMGSSLGEGCSPVVHDGKLVIVRDHAGQSMIHVLNAEDGTTIWEKQRDEKNSWATPRVLKHENRTQVITPGSNLVRSYDLDTGEVIWQCKGLTGNCIPCPVTRDGVVYCMSGYEGFSLLAIKLSEQGDVSDSDAVQWKHNQGTPYIPSPVLYDGRLYFTQSNKNILSSVDSKTGNMVIQRTRLPNISNVYSSPVAADDRIYFTGRGGMTVVIKHSGELEVLSKNKLAEPINASPAMAGNQLFLRSNKSLYCISETIE